MDLSSVIYSAVLFCGSSMVVVIGGSYLAYKLKRKSPFQGRP
jgi:hypothetical protein